ncbi:MAG TPA: nuclear transport factor 2 family protein [Pyrinomonadaceae bacterium]|nr:nuclear transport factor 2 family protein [Pyrinomonadaceae bacterium]
MSLSAESGIREAINYYAEGMGMANVEILKEAFHQQAILCGYLGEEIIAAPIEGLYDWVNSNPAPAETGEIFGCAILAIEVTGRVAAATPSILTVLNDRAALRNNEVT